MWVRRETDFGKVACDSCGSLGTIFRIAPGKKDDKSFCLCEDCLKKMITLLGSVNEYTGLINYDR